MKYWNLMCTQCKQQITKCNFGNEDCQECDIANHTCPGYVTTIDIKHCKFHSLNRYVAISKARETNEWLDEIFKSVEKIQDFNKDIKPNLLKLFDAVDKFNVHKQEAIVKDEKFILSKQQLADSKNIDELYEKFIKPLKKFSYKLSNGINGREFQLFYWLENLSEEQSLNIDKSEYSYDPFSRMKFYLEQIELEVNKRFMETLHNSASERNK